MDAYRILVEEKSLFSLFHIAGPPAVLILVEQSSCQNVHVFCCSCIHSDN